jgi:hypothetical protein
VAARALVRVPGIGPIISGVRTNPQNGRVAHTTKHLVANEVEAKADGA